MTNRHALLASLVVLAPFAACIDAARADDDGPLPSFEFKGVILHPKDLKYTPTGDLIHPTIVKTEGRVKNALGQYYLYYAPHKHVAMSMAYSDSLDGPWTEYEHNPVVEGPSAPDCRWIAERGEFFMWGHTKNSQTELWTSKDGIHFEHHSVSVTAKNIGTRNATYSRMYEYPLAKYGSKYVMVYSGFLEDREIRCVWLAHSKDAVNWTQLTTPLVEPIEGEMNDCYGPALLRWKGRNLLTYQDHTTWRGGNLKCVELDEELTPVGAGGERHVLLDPPNEPPLNDRYRGAEFYREDGKLYLYGSASRSPRLIVYLTAEDEAAEEEPKTEREPVAEPRPTSEAATRPKREKREEGEQPSKRKKPSKSKSKKSGAPAPASEDLAEAGSLDGVLEGLQLETIYETKFDEPLRLVREDELLEDGTIAHAPTDDVEWVLEGAKAEVTAKDGRMHLENNGDHCVFWNARELPESFVAEWDFQHHAPRGTVIVFFAAQAHDGGSIFAPGLPKRVARFGNYTRGEIDCYHTSYSATDEEGTPRGATHLKKDGKDVEKAKLANGRAPIDGKTGKPFRIRLAKLKNRIVLEIDGQISFDVTDDEGTAYGSGRLGFRQMRHTVEGSYGFLKVHRVKFAN